MELVLAVLRGKAGVRIDSYHHSNLKGPAGGGAYFTWNNKGAGAEGPRPIEKLPPFLWAKAPPPGKIADEMVIALKELSRRMVGKKPPALVLEEVRSSVEARPANRVLSIYSYCALDDVSKLLDALGDEDPTHVLERDTAIFTLRRWLARDAGQSALLYDMKNKTGLLVATRKYRPGEAAIILQLLHDFSDDARKSPETFQTLADYLGNEKVAIAELASWQLRHLGLGLVKSIPFNAALPRDAREMAANEVRKLVADGKLPPTGAGPASAPPKQP
jgi:hypothetical protein